MSGLIGDMRQEADWNRVRAMIFQDGKASREAIIDGIVTEVELAALGWEKDEFLGNWHEKGFG